MTMIKNIREYLDVIDSNAADLSNIAISLVHTGNDKLARILMNVVEDLTVSVKHINKELSDDLDRQFKQACENSQNMLKSVLAGNKIKESKDNE